MKKWNFVLIAALVILSQVLAACGPAAEPTTAVPVATEVPQATAVQQATAAQQATAVPVVPTEIPTPTTPPEPVDILLWAQATVTEAAAPPDDWIAYQRIRDELNINLTYVIVPTGADGEAKLNAAAAANDLPDLFQLVSASGDNRGALLRLVDLGLVSPVDDLMPLMPERTRLHYNDPLAIDLVTFNGQQYGLPEPPPLPRREGLVIRKDWLDALNLSVPTTPEELLAVATAFTEQDPDGNGQDDTYGLGGFIVGQGLGNRFEFIMGAYGVPGLWNFIDTDNFGLNVRNSQYPEALAFFKSLVDANVIDPDWPTLTRDDFRARWKQGLFGIMWEDFAAISNRSNYEPFDTNFPNGEWIPVAAPVGPNGDAYYGVYTGRGQIFAISQNAADEGKGPAIAALLEWMATDGYYLLGFGEEGVNYIIDANGNISTEGLDPAQAYTSAERQPFGQMRNQLVFYNSPQEIAARYPTYNTINGRLMDPMSFLTFFQSQPWVDGRGIQVILPPANAADFDRFYSEGILQFVLGQVELNDSTWAEYLAGLDALGAADYEAAARQNLIDAGLLK
jgi:putative aldouronate transport system substrate-binding protein